MAYNPNAKIVIKVEINVGALGWVDVTHRGRKASCIIRQGRSPNAIQAETSRLDLTLGNPDGWLTEGNANSPWYPAWGRGCEIRVSRIGLAVSPAERFHGQIDTIEEVFPGGDLDATVEVTAVGTLGILGRGSDPLKSAMTRGIPLDSPLAWWPLEETEKSGLTGGLPMTVVGQVNFGVNSGHPGSAPLPDYTAGGQLKARLPNGSVSNSWRMEFTARFGTGFDTISVSDFTVPLQIQSPNGTVNVFEFLVSTGQAVLQWQDTSGAFTGLLNSAKDVDDGQWHHFRADVSQSGGDVSASLTIDGVTYGPSSLVGKTLDSTNSTVIVNVNGDVAGYVGAVGQITWWSPHTPTSIDTTVLAKGHAGETAADRMARLCDEEGVGFELTGTAADTAAMGPQLIDTLVANLRDCETADQGLMHDNGTAGAIGYRTRTDLYNQAASIAVTRGAVEPDLRAVRDNQYVRNDITSSRPNGGSSHVADETHIALIRARLKDFRTPNVYADGQLTQDAAWALHLGTDPGARYNAVGINLRNADGALLADSVAGHAIGDRFTVATSALPPQHTDSINGLTVGWTEYLDADTWRFRANLMPYQPYEVFELEAANNRGRLDTAGSVLVDAVNSSTTSLKFATTSGPIWINSTDRPQDFPFDVGIAGQRNTVTAIAKATASAPVAGTMTHAVNAGVTPGLPASIAAGNLLLVLAAIRNSGTGIPNTPSGYIRLPVFDATANVQVFAKIAVGGDTAPFITFTGSVANADTSAQMCRVPGNWYDVNNVLVASASCLNSTVSLDIITPGLPLTNLVNDCLIIWAGWKQDDWTSASFGFSTIGSGSTATGDDQALAWYYQIQTTAAARDPNLITATGTASVISRAAVFALRCDYQTATVTRGVNGVSKALSAGAAISLWKPSVIAL